MHYWDKEKRPEEEEKKKAGADDGLPESDSGTDSEGLSVSLAGKTVAGL
jgi:hypothetical protein